MSASDCLALADYMYKRSEFRRAAEWYRIALSVFTKPKNNIAFKFYAPKRKELEKMFVISRLQEGKFKEAIIFAIILSQGARPQDFDSCRQPI